MCWFLSLELSALPSPSSHFLAAPCPTQPGSHRRLTCVCDSLLFTTLPPFTSPICPRLRLFAPFFYTLGPPFLFLLLCFVPHLHPICTCLQVSAARTHLNNTGSRKLGGSTWNRNQTSGTWLFSFLFQCLGRDLVYSQYCIHSISIRKSLRLSSHYSRSFLPRIPNSQVTCRHFLDNRPLQTFSDPLDNPD